MRDRVIKEINKKEEGKKMMKRIRTAFIMLCSSLFILTACTSIDCPVENSVFTKYELRKAGGLSVDTLRDTLTISTPRMMGNDTVLINRMVNTTSFDLPISYSNAEDTLYFEVSGKTRHSIDTLYIIKDNIPHFESVDCQVSFFHNLKEAKTTNHAIDSVVINKSFVDYDQTKKHIHIYFKSRR